MEPRACFPHRCLSSLAPDGDPGGGFDFALDLEFARLDWIACGLGSAYTIINNTIINIIVSRTAWRASLHLSRHTTPAISH